MKKSRSKSVRKQCKKRNIVTSETGRHGQATRCVREEVVGVVVAVLLGDARLLRDGHALLDVHGLARLDVQLVLDCSGALSAPAWVQVGSLR